MFVLPHMHKRLYIVPDCSVISNCGTPTEKILESLYYDLKPINVSSKSYVRDTSDFLKRLKELVSIPQNVPLTTADVVGLYPSITHHHGS